MLLLDLNCSFWFTSFLIFQPLFAIPSNFILIRVILAGMLCFHILQLEMIFKFWVLWACWLRCCKQKVFFLELFSFCCYWFLLLLSYWISLLVELDEIMLDALGILPQRKQHKKLLLVSYEYIFFLVIAMLGYFLICSFFPLHVW